jgi:hypothetical protein
MVSERLLRVALRSSSADLTGLVRPCRVILGLAACALGSPAALAREGREPPRAGSPKSQSHQDPTWFSDDPHRMHRRILQWRFAETPKFQGEVDQGLGRDHVPGPRSLHERPSRSGSGPPPKRLSGGLEPSNRPASRRSPKSKSASQFAVASLGSGGWKARRGSRNCNPTTHNNDCYSSIALRVCKLTSPLVCCGVKIPGAGAETVSDEWFGWGRKDSQREPPG